MSARLIKIAAFYLVVGVTMGIVMGITHEFVLAPVHAHINLLGWATLAIIGVIYHAYPAAGETRLATVHFWIHNTTLPVFMVGLGFALTGHEAFLPVAIAGALGVAIGIVVFAVNIWRTVGSAARAPKVGTPIARAAT
jgi:cbb3-type cytochrome oxidase subunit 1